MKTHIKALFLIFLLGLLSFSNSINNPFMIDDHAFFEEKLQNIKYLPLHFLPDKNRALHIEGESADPFYRPLSTVIPMLSYLAFKNNTAGHHLTNLILFCLSSWGIYLFLMYLGAAYLPAFLTAVFYLVHPINGIVVNYITASIFPVQVMLMLAALYFIRGNRPYWSCVFYILSTFCHEMAMFLPFYALVLVAVLVQPQAHRFHQAWKLVWPLFAVLALICVFRMFFSSLQESILNKINLYNHLTFPQYLATWTMLLSWYLSRLFWPKNIVLIMAHQPLDSGLGIWFMVLIALLALAGYLLWTYRRQRLIFLGLAWFIFGFVPSMLACFFQPIHGLMIEPHWFIFPVMGFFFFIASIFSKMLETKKIPARVALAIFTFVLIFFTRWHNWVWGDEVRYCTYWLDESPAFVAVNSYLAKAYELRGQNDLARKHYLYTIQRGYKDYIAYTNMGLIDMKEGHWESARQNLLKVMEIDPRASVAVNDLGVIYFKEANYPEALKYFQRARDLNRFTVLPYLDISKTYLKLGDRPKAIEALWDVLNIVPGQENAMVDLIQIYMAEKDKDNVVKIAHLMLKYSGNPYTLQNAGILLKYYGFPDEAQNAMMKARWIFNSARKSDGN